MSTAEHARPIRLFFAIRPAEAAGAAELVALHQTARRLLQGEGRWVAADHLHLTLAFAATFPASRLAALREGVLEAVAGIAPFVMRSCGLALWPSPSRARLLVALFEPEPSCTLLAARLAALLEALGVPVEKRPFRPHITLARLKGHCSLSQQSQPACQWRCEALELLQSHLDQHGSRYRCLASWPLLGHGPDDRE